MQIARHQMRGHSVQCLYRMLVCEGWERTQDFDEHVIFSQIVHKREPTAEEHLEIIELVESYSKEIKDFFAKFNWSISFVGLIYIVARIKSLLPRYKHVAALAQRGRASDC